MNYWKEFLPTFRILCFLYSHLNLTSLSTYSNYGLSCGRVFYSLWTLWTIGTGFAASWCHLRKHSTDRGMYIHKIQTPDGGATLKLDLWPNAIYSSFWKVALKRRLFPNFQKYYNFPRYNCFPFCLFREFFLLADFRLCYTA